VVAFWVGIGSKTVFLTRRKRFDIFVLRADTIRPLLLTYENSQSDGERRQQVLLK
jgi:hypothetical protein